MITDDPETAQKFFAAAFGWTAKTPDKSADGEYTMFSIGEDMAGGMMQKTAEMGPIPNHWSVYFAVDDCEGCASKITELGGKVLNGPFDTGVGRMAVAQDPQGAVFSFIQMSQPTA